MSQTETGGQAPQADGQAPAATTGEGGQASPTPTMTAEQAMAILEQTRKEAAANRVKANELAAQLQKITDERKAAEEAAMVEQNKFKELYEQNKEQLAALQAELTKAKEAEALLAQQREARKADLLTKFTAEQRETFKDFSVEHLEAITQTLLQPQAQPQTQVTPGAGQQATTPANPTIPFQNDRLAGLQKALYGR